MDQALIDEIYRVKSGLRIWRICHAGFLIKYRDIVIIIDPAIEIKDDADPYLSEHSENIPLLKILPLLARDLRRVDLVLVSHADEDHCGSKTMVVLEPKTQVFAAPPETASKLKGIGISCSKIRRAYFKEPI